MDDEHQQTARWSKFLVGKIVKVSHPITCLNPDEYFEVVELQYDQYADKVWIRGDNTCWFNIDMIMEIRTKDQS